MCAFHPDRPTGVTCSRCERPICPDDMIDAPVGIHCPVCAGVMREGAIGEASYRARTAIERNPTARKLAGVSLANAIIAVNVVVFVLMVATGRPTASRTLFDFGALTAPLDRSQWWRVFTSMFVHIGAFHLLFNMFALFLFGRAVEGRYGKTRFLVLYLASGLLGAGASLAFTGVGLRAGASGGVFGILGAWVAFYVLHRSASGARSQLQSLFALIALNLYIGAVSGGIDNAAHVGGLIGGFLVGLGLEVAGRRRGGFRAAGVIAVAIVVAGAVALIVPNSF